MKKEVTLIAAHPDDIFGAERLKNALEMGRYKKVGLTLPNPGEETQENLDDVFGEFKRADKTIKETVIGALDELQEIDYRDDTNNLPKQKREICLRILNADAYTVHVTKDYADGSGAEIKFIDIPARLVEDLKTKYRPSSLDGFLDLFGYNLVGFSEMCKDKGISKDVLFELPPGEVMELYKEFNDHNYEWEPLYIKGLRKVVDYLGIEIRDLDSPSNPLRKIMNDREAYMVEQIIKKDLDAVVMKPSHVYQMNSLFAGEKNTRELLEEADYNVKIVDLRNYDRNTLETSAN